MAVMTMERQRPDPSVEKWRDVPSIPGLQASTFGRIRRHPKRGQMPNGGIRNYDSDGTYGSIRRAGKTATHTYRGAWYRDLGNVRINKAVCEAFHGPKPFPEAIALHRDEDSHNNVPDNLRWGTRKERLNAPGFIAYCESRTGENSPTRKDRRRNSKGGSV